LYRYIVRIICDILNSNIKFSTRTSRVARKTTHAATPAPLESRRRQHKSNQNYSVRATTSYTYPETTETQFHTEKTARGHVVTCRTSMGNSQVWKDSYEEGRTNTTKRDLHETNDISTRRKKRSVTKAWANDTPAISRTHENRTPPAQTSTPFTADSKLRYSSIIRLQDFEAIPSKDSAIISVKFHESMDLALTTRRDSGIQLFRANGESNTLVHQLAVPRTTRVTADFSQSGNNVIICGVGQITIAKLRDEGLHVDSHVQTSAAHGTFLQSQMLPLLGLPDSFDINLFSTNSKSCVGRLKCSTRFRTGTFHPSNPTLFTITEDGMLKCWDIRMHRCFKAANGFDDVKCIKITPDAHVLLTGCGNGIVNVYKTSDIVWNNDLAHKGQIPAKSIKALTTEIDSISVSPQSELAVFSSSGKRDALRAFHLPTMKVLNTWPRRSTPLHYVAATAFNHDGRLLAVANARGRIMTYRLGNKD